MNTNLNTITEQIEILQKKFVEQNCDDSKKII